MSYTARNRMTKMTIVQLPVQEVQWHSNASVITGGRPSEIFPLS